MGKFTIFKGGNGNYYFNFKASNGEKVLASEGYVFKSSCENGIASVKTNALYDSRYNRLTASNGQYYFTLTAMNGQVIATSELYTTTASRENGISVVKAQAPSAPTEDLT